MALLSSWVKSPNIKYIRSGRILERVMMRAVFPFISLSQPQPFFQKWKANAGSHIRSKRALRSDGIDDHQIGYTITK
jgi:hypothetical protein